MRRQRALALIAISSLVLAGCGSLPLLSGRAESRAPMAEQVFVEEMAPEMEAPMEAPSAGMAADNAQPGGQPRVESVQERLVIRNANLSIVVEDPAEAVDDISAMAQEMGGFVVSSNVFETTFGESAMREPIRAEQASITIRVPSDRLEDALARIKQGAVEVERQNVTGQDVTEEFTDLESRLGNLEAAEAQLREIMASATKTEDVLRVFEELRRIREEIEVIRGRLQYLEQSARLSAISVELKPDVATQPLQIGRWTPQGTAREAVEALVRALQFLADAAIWAVICVLPVGVIVGVPAWVAIRAILRRRRRSQESEAKQEAGASPPPDRQ